jgi:hypothetical protein
LTLKAPDGKASPPKVDVHWVNELKGRSSGYPFAIHFSGYVSPGSDPAAASG